MVNDTDRSNGSRFLKCSICSEKKLIAKKLKICIDCIRKEPEETLHYAKEAHSRIREEFGLPSSPPKSEEGIPCNLCSNKCIIGIGETSYCGLKWNYEGKLESFGNLKKGLLYAYLDSHVTNCCSAWFCPGGTGAGYPKFARSAGSEYGYYNLAIFLYGCNFNCLFCQNISHKKFSFEDVVSTRHLIDKTHENQKISCWCFFGGSAEPQLPFAIETSRIALEEMQNRLLRICFEWNGCGNQRLVREAAELSLKTGGNMKFDLKCFSPSLSYVLSGVSNRRAYDNFEMIAKEFYKQRPDNPVLTATTLLVPEYIDMIEIELIAKFIADLNPEIPYSLLVFHPDFMMTDLPVTPQKQVVECYKAAKKHLKRVHIGNFRFFETL
jgi:pyruvate formate lyase activating enzyme